MGKRWCGSSAQDRKGDAERFGLAALMFAFGLAGSPAASVVARAEEPAPVGTEQSTAPTPSLVPAPGPGALSGAQFLQLPAYDLEAQPGAQPGQNARIGDILKMTVKGLPASEGIRFENAPGGAPLEDQGWAVFGSSVTPLKAGSLTLPSLMIRDSKGEVVGRTNPFSIEVASAIAKDDPQPDQPAELAPPVALGFPWWALALVGVLLAAALGVAIYWLIRWSRGRKNAASAKKAPEPPKPEHEVALAALAALEQKGHLQRGEFKKHYFAVSEILKNYLGARYRFDAPESTTREMIALLDERKNIGESILDELETLFEEMDRVKFTDHVPDGAEAAGIVGRARQLVLATKRAVVLEPVMPTGPGPQGGGTGK